MTVFELIKKLQKLPGNLDVVVYDDSDGHRWLDSSVGVFPGADDDDAADLTPRVVLSFNGPYDD